MFSSQGVCSESLYSYVQSAYALSVEVERAHEKIRGLMHDQQQSEIKISTLEEEIIRLKEQLALAQQRHFGKKSEISGEPVAPLVFNVQTVEGYTRQRKPKSCGRKLDISGLPEHIIEHDLEEEDKICQGCHGCLHLIEKERTAGQLEILPQRFYVAVHVRYKYGCRTCQTIQPSPKIASPIPKAIAGASLLTEVLISKYQYHLPLYRQSKMMASLGVIIPDNTLGHWVMQLGEGLMRLHAALFNEIISAQYLQVDETPVKILNPNKKGYVWTYVAPHLGKGLVVFELALTRSKDVVETRLNSFKGLLQTDGYSGYNGLRHQKGIEGLGCLTHARRKFREVIKLSKNNHGIAAEVIERLKPLYALEEKMRQLKYDFRTRKRLRQKIAFPILKSLHTFLREILPKVPPKSSLGGAIGYMINQWRYITAYLRHGMAEIDTNQVENKIREIALGRKNWMFMGNKNSGQIHALFYSLVVSAVINNLNPRPYLHYVISKIHDLRRGIINPLQLLPHIIDKTDLEKFTASLLVNAKIVLDSS